MGDEGQREAMVRAPGKWGRWLQPPRGDLCWGRWVGRDGGERTGERCCGGLARVCGDVRLGDGGSADGRSGWEWNRCRARARLNWVSQGQRCGRCRVRRRAERVSRPAREKNRRRRVLVVHLLAQTDPRRPAGQVVGHHRPPGAVGGEAAGRHVVQTDAVLESRMAFSISAWRRGGLQSRVSPSPVMKP